MLRGRERLEATAVAGRDLGERRELVEGLVVPFLAGFLVEAREAVEFHDRAGRAEQIAAGVDAALEIEVDRGGVIDRVGHLAGDEPEPDELVEPILLAVQVAAHRLGRARRIGRPNRLVRLLRALLLLATPEAGRIGQVARAELALDPAARALRRVNGDAGGVGTHVGDQTERALGAQVDTLVELLGGAHGALGGEAESLGGFLLERGSGERGRRVLDALAALDVADDEGDVLDVAKHGVGFRFVGKPERLAIDLVQPGLELAVGLLEQGGDRPVLLGGERADLRFTLDDQPERHGLHASRGESRADRLPEQRADLVADQAVQDAPGLLRLDLPHVQRARMLEGAPHRVAGDLVEEHAPEAAAVAGFVAELFGDVPGDRFTLPVGVGR